MEQLPLYQCHKKVRAAKIVGIATDQMTGNRVLNISDPFPEGVARSINVDNEWRNSNPGVDVGGYFVEYADGYTSYSPAAPFEACYTLIPEPVENRKMTTATCGCNLETGTVCKACENTAAKVVEEASEYINDFIKKRFPSGLDGDIRQIISECVLDGFYDGARYSEQTRQEEAEQEKSPIILA